jgi:hypothetical protein
MPDPIFEKYDKYGGHPNINREIIKSVLYDPSLRELSRFESLFEIRVYLELESALSFPLIFPQKFLKELMPIEDLQFDDSRGLPSESIIVDRSKQEESQVDESDPFKFKYWKKNEEALLFLRDEQNFLYGWTKIIDMNLREPLASKQFRQILHLVRATQDTEGRQVSCYADYEWFSFRLKKLIQIDTVTSYLLKELEELKPEITPYISFEENGIGEIFMEIQEMFILVRIMSNTIGSKLRWREDRQEIFVCRKNGRKPWQSATNAVQKEFAPQEMLVRENFRLMGVSSRKRKRPLLKVLLLDGITIDPANNPAFLYHDIPKHPYLKIKGNSNVFVFELEGLVKFIRKSVERGNFNPTPTSATI